MKDGGHLGEHLVDFVDGRLDPANRALADQHLAVCGTCRDDLRRIEAGRKAARMLRSERPVPDDLAASIGALLDRQAATPAEPPARIGAGRRWIGPAAAAAALLAIALVWLQPWRPSLVSSVQAQADRVDRSGLPGEAIRSGDIPTIERHLAERGGPTLRVRVIDLAMMGWRPEGGAIVQLAGRPAALYSYRNEASERLFCQMFEGRLDELPATADVRTHRGFQFKVFRQADLTLVFWQEGPLVCVLAARLPPDAVVALAFEKAMRPS